VTVNLSPNDLRAACTALFGAPDLPGHHGDGWSAALRSAFRRRVFETHPDRAQALGRSEQELREEFSLVNEAYQLLSSLPPPEPWQAVQGPPPAPRFVRTVRPFEQRRHRAAAQRPPPARPRPAPPPARPQERYYAGPLPQRALRLGEYLYYSGLISWQALIDAISWQRRGHQQLGKLAVQWGYLSPDELRLLLRRHQWQRLEGERFGEFLLRHGEITGFQLLALLGRQKRLRRPLGEFFVERGLCAPAELDAIARWQAGRRGDPQRG
jgi:hypothetical protein